jgi:hypothetical protein
MLPPHRIDSKKNIYRKIAKVAKVRKGEGLDFMAFTQICCQWLGWSVSEFVALPRVRVVDQGMGSGKRQLTAKSHTKKLEWRVGLPKKVTLLLRTQH